MKLRLFLLIIVVLIISCFSGMVYTQCEDLTEGAIGGAGAQVTELIVYESAVRADKPTGSGPYTVGNTDASIPRPSLPNLLARIFYPATSTGLDAPSDHSDAPYSAITWAPGAGGHYDDYDSLGTYVASWGFLMAICNFPTGSLNQETVDSHGYVLDFFEAENSNATSNFYGLIDVNMFGATGHSNGGWGAIRGTVEDIRFKAVCTLAAAGHADGSDVSGLIVPLQLIVGNNDNTFKPVSEANYANANPIKSLIKINGATHSGPFHLEYLISFFKFWLVRDDEYYTFIYGDEIQQDVADGTIQLSYDLGLTADADASKFKVEEDEQFTFIGEGIITNPISPDRSIAKYEWDFDDDGNYDWNSTSTGSVAYIWYENVALQATLRVTDTWGLMATSEPISITINNRKPTANAGEDQTVNEDEVVLLDARGSSDTPSDLVNLSYAWDFGNDEYSGWLNEPTINYTYINKGTYTVTLTVRDDDYATDITSIKIIVNNVEPTCTAMVDHETVNEDDVINFTGTGSDSPSDMPYLKYYWDFGDNTYTEPMSSPNTTHKYTTKGIYNATLTIEDDNGANGNSTVFITVNNVKPTCTAIVDNQIVNEDEIVSFSGIGYDSLSDVSFLSYNWDFGDGNNSGWNPTVDAAHAYVNEDTYLAILTVKDDNNDIDTTTVCITVNNVAPTVHAKADETIVDEDEIIAFKAKDYWDTASDIDSLEFIWDFGDYGMGQGKKVTHAYISANTYTITLTVIDDNGAMGADIIEITVNNVEPTAIIKLTKRQVNIDEEFTIDGSPSLDTPSDKLNLTYEWDFGDGEFGEGITTNHSYKEPDKYTVTLTVKDDNNVTSKATKTITVKASDDDERVSEKDKEESYLWVIVGIVIVIIIVVLFLVFIRSKKKPGQDEIQPQQPYQQYHPQPQQQYPQSWKGQPSAETYREADYQPGGTAYPIVSPSYPPTYQPPRPEQLRQPQILLPLQQYPLPLLPPPEPQQTTQIPIPSQPQSQEYQTMQQNLCATCGQPLSYIEQNNSYYCYQCQKYE